MKHPQRTTPLNVEQAALMREVLQRWAPDALADLFPKACDNSLVRAERLRLSELVAAEFVATGLDAAWEPLARGLKLEELIDAINPPNR